MHFLAIINRDGGTLKDIDLAAFREHMERTMADAGHGLDFHVVDGSEIVAALNDAAGSTRHDAIIAGGGDGTVSAAAGALMHNDKVLAVLPAGTMNLFARSLGIPLDIHAAVEGFAAGDVRQVDVATANGRPFVHQYSIGLHPEVLHQRATMAYRSRIGKMLASGRAAFAMLVKPPRLRVALTIDGVEIKAVTSGIGVTNNLFGEGHLPYADKPDGGVLGIYLTRARRRRDFLVFFLDMALGRWKASEHVEIHEARKAVLEVQSAHRRFHCAIDGELQPLEERTELFIHPGALKILAPPTP